jgi:hypothetical protein
MLKFLWCLFFVISFNNSYAQKIEYVNFNLYTDSLKKGLHNYINVDGYIGNGKFIPLDTNYIVFSSNTGRWIGNNLIIDSSYLQDSVVIHITLKQNTAIKKTTTVYIKKLKDPELLKTEEEILQGVIPKKKSTKKLR